MSARVQHLTPATMQCQRVYVPSGNRTASFDGRDTAITVDRKLTTVRNFPSSRYDTISVQPANLPRRFSNPIRKTENGFAVKQLVYAPDDVRYGFAGGKQGPKSFDHAENSNKMYRRYCYTPAPCGGNNSKGDKLSCGDDWGKADFSKTALKNWLDNNQNQFRNQANLWKRIEAPVQGTYTVDDRYSVVGEKKEEGSKYCIMQQEQDPEYPVFTLYPPTATNAVEYFLRGSAAFDERGQNRQAQPVKCQYFEIDPSKKCEDYITITNKQR